MSEILLATIEKCYAGFGNMNGIEYLKVLQAGQQYRIRYPLGLHIHVMQSPIVAVWASASTIAILQNPSCNIEKNYSL